MKKLLLVVMSMAWVLVAGVALAADPGKAKEAASLHAAKKDDAKVVATLKAGDAVTVLVTQGEWMRVKTAAGKLGWIKASAIEVEKAAGDGIGDLDMSGVEVASKEQDSVGAVRGRPGEKRRAVVVAAGYSDADAAALAQALAKNTTIQVVARVVKPQATGAGPTGPAGGVAGGKALASALGADLVIAVSPSKAGPKGAAHVRYEIIDARRGKMIASGNEPAAKGTAGAFRVISDQVRKVR